MAPRAASTYRAARRNASRGSVWNSSNYYKDHDAKYWDGSFRARPWLPIAIRRQNQNAKDSVRAMAQVPLKVLGVIKSLVHRKSSGQRGA